MLLILHHAERVAIWQDKACALGMADKVPMDSRGAIGGFERGKVAHREDYALVQWAIFYAIKECGIA